MYRRFLIALSFILLSIPTAGFQTPSSHDTNRAHSTYDPPRSRTTPSDHGGFVDFALRQINPGNVDYGCQIDETRKFVLQSSIKQGYYWTAVASACVLLITFTLLVTESRKCRRHAMVAARFLSWYHNELVHAQLTAVDAIARHDQLKNVLDNASSSAPRQNEMTASGKNGPMLATTAGSQTVLGAAANHDLVTELNMLRQERPVLQRTIRQLRQELNERKQKGQPPKTE